MDFTKVIVKGALFSAALCGAVALAPEAKADPRTHDGFYLQLDAGLGYLSASYDVPVSPNYHGLTTPFAFLLGGTVGPVVIGGGFFGDHATSPGASSDAGSADAADVALTLVGIGLFADIYPDPTDGLHIQPFLGFGGLEASVNGNAGGSDPTGLVLALGAGYDWWVGDEWSIGVMGRVAYAPRSINDVGVSVHAPAVLATFTYH
jgi:hypothetical protein